MNYLIPFGVFGQPNDEELITNSAIERFNGLAAS